jgi:5S rRNA maturation endonuclease (ribonuclease M5)
MRTVKKWAYKTKDGNVVGHVNRLENEAEHGGSNSRKQIIPFFKENGQSGIPEGLPGEHRIYGLETVTDYSKPIFITEGEKCAYALQELGYQAITSLGGSGQAHLADWSVIKDAQRIYILPDNDGSGRKYAYTVYQRFRAIKNAAEVKLLRFPITNKSDVCDYLKTVPELSDWNELDSLLDHPGKEVARAILDRYISTNSEKVPPSWRFLITKHKHKLISVNDLSHITLPKRETVLSPWLTEGSINMVFADRGIGKTFFCLSCAVALANGDSFLSYRADKPVPVLYLDGEMQATAMQERLKHLTNGKPTKEPLSIFTPDCQDLTDHIPDIGDPNGRLEIDELVKAVNPKVVFIDNISTFIRTGHENEGDSWSPVQEWAVQLRKNGIAVVFIHHANKEGKQRGSHKKEDVMDIVIQLKRPDDFLQGTDDTRMMIKYTKARHMGAFDTQDIEATLKDVDGSLRWTWEAGDLSLQRANDLLNDGLSMAEVAEEFGVSKSTVHRWKKKAQTQHPL